MEIWKNIEGYEQYKVSNLGRIYSEITDKVLNQTISGRDKNRHYIKLRKDGIQHTKIVSRLVAKAFIPNPDNLATVNHKDGNTLNDRVENLE